MATKTVAEKLWMKPGKKVAFFNAPENNYTLLGGIPEEVELANGTPADILLAYIENRDQLEAHLAKLKGRVKADGALWIAYYKGTASVPTNINRDSIAKYALTNGLKPVAMISINDDWSGLRLKITN
jgi:hypothetical protein